MRLTKLALNLVFFISLTASGQYHVTVVDGTTLRGSSIEWKDPLSGNDRIIVGGTLEGSKEIPMSRVLHFEVKEGYYRVVKTETGFLYFRKEESGTHITIYSVTFHPLFGIANAKRFHYEVDSSGIKKVIYKFVRQDVGQNAAVGVYIKKFKNLRLLSGVGIATGLALITGGLLQMNEKGGQTGTQSQDQVDAAGLMISGVVVLFTPAFLRAAKEKQLLNALRAYDDGLRTAN